MNHTVVADLKIYYELIEMYADQHRLCEILDWNVLWKEIHLWVQCLITTNVLMLQENEGTLMWHKSDIDDILMI